MRKIEQRIIEAIRNGEHFHDGPNSVEPIESGDLGLEPRVNVWLYSTCIAQVYADRIVIRSGGWHTPTTESRLSSILCELTDYGIFQRDFTWYTCRRWNRATEKQFEEGAVIPRIGY